MVPSGILKSAGGRDESGVYKWRVDWRKLARASMEVQPESQMAGSEERVEDSMAVKREV